MKSCSTELLLKRFDSCIEKEEKNFEYFYFALSNICMFLKVNVF